MLVKSYYGPGGTNLYYPIAPPGSNTTHSTFPPGAYGSPSGQGGPTLTAFNGGVNGPMSVGQCGIPGAAGVLQASSFSAAHASLSQQLAAQAAAVAAAASQHQLGVPSLQPQTSHSSSGSLSCSPSIPVTANGTPNSSLLAMSSLSSSPAAKKFRPAYARPSSKSQRYIPKPLPAELGNLKLYSSPDILICGNCREMFSDLVDMIEHKKHYCKLRFTCKCDMTNDEACLNGSLCSATNSGDPDDEIQWNPNKSLEGPRVSAHSETSKPRVSTTSSASTTKWLHCITCKSPFSNAWDLMVHVQTAHMLNIYLLADSKKMGQQQQQNQTTVVNVSEACFDGPTGTSPRSSSTSPQSSTKESGVVPSSAISSTIVCVSTPDAMKNATEPLKCISNVVESGTYPSVVTNTSSAMPSYTAFTSNISTTLSQNATIPQ